MSCGGGSSGIPDNVTIKPTTLISSSCSNNYFQKPFYFSEVPKELPSYIVFDFNKPYIDVRYTQQTSTESGIGLDRYPYTAVDTNNYVGYKSVLVNGDTTSFNTAYAKTNIDGSGGYVSCVNNNLVFSTVVNGKDSIPIDTYGGPSVTFGYSSNAGYHPWADNKVLHFTGDFKQAYQSDPNEIGAQLNIGIFIENKKDNSKFLYNINLYNSFGLLTEHISYDPTLVMAYASTNVSNKSRYITKGRNSVDSNITTTTLFTPNTWPDHFSFYITKENLINAFNDTKSKVLIDSNPSDWTIYGFVVQSEINVSYNQVLATSGTNINLTIENEVK